MSGREAQQKPRLLLSLLAGLLLFPAVVEAQPRESTEPIGGITFDPPRRATIRHKNRQVIRGELIGVSPELVHLRLPNSREFHYEFADILRIRTVDGDFRYTSAYDTYRELEERARGLPGVTIEAPIAGGIPVVPMPRPPAPALPEMVDPPGWHRLDEVQQPQDRVSTASTVPEIPAAGPPVPATQTGPAQPFHETSAFKMGFLVACGVVILLWWRNRVG